MEEITLEEANKTAKQIFPNAVDAGEIQDPFYKSDDRPIIK